MRIGTLFLAALSAASAAAFFPFNSSAAGSADGVAVQYRFAGSADLSVNINFDRPKRILNLPPAKVFQNLVLDRWSGVFWNALQFDPGGDAATLLRPLLDDLVQAESVGSFGGHDKDRVSFVLAARLDAQAAARWEKNLETALHSQGEALTVEGFSGRRWDRPGKPALWLLRARDWTVAGDGEGLLPVRAEYLRKIKQDNRPVPVAQDSWLSADVDWPLLANWAPVANGPLRLARTSLNVTSETGRMRATVHVTYPEPIPWTPQPWRIPKELVSSPLSSFSASRNLGAFLKPDQTLSRLSSDPLNSELFCWALRELPLLNYAAWPVADATNTLRKLGADAPAVLNPWLAKRNRTDLTWSAKDDRLAWTHVHLTTPTLEPVHGQSGDFLLARLFPMIPKHIPASDQLWSQFQQRDDLVYYDWEITGLRLLQWRLLTELLPVFPPQTPEDIARRQKAVQTAKPPTMPGSPATPLAITEAWLAEISTPALDNTVTEVTRNSPTELTVKRNAQLLFTGLELVLLSHWLADAPVGPIDNTLLPQAKMSGPGLPRIH